MAVSRSRIRSATRTVLRCDCFELIGDLPAEEMWETALVKWFYLWIPMMDRTPLPTDRRRISVPLMVDGIVAIGAPSRFKVSHPWAGSKASSPSPR